MAIGERIGGFGSHSRPISFRISPCRQGPNPTEVDKKVRAVGAMGTRELLVVLAVVVMAAVGAGAQSSSASPAPATSQAPTVRQQTPFGRTMSTVITVSISVFFFLLFFCAYINQCRRRRTPW